MSLLDAQVLAAAAVLALLAGCLLILASPLRAALAVLPLVLVTPWQARGLHGESAAALSACAAFLWLMLLCAVRFTGRYRSAASLVAVAVTVAAFYFARTGEAWSAPLWYRQVRGYPFNMVDLAYNKWFYPPLLVALSPLLWECRRRWWFLPTVLWAAVLAAGALLHTAAGYLQWSLPLQMALIVPFALAALSGPDTERAAPCRPPQGAPTC